MIDAHEHDQESSGKPNDRGRRETAASSDAQHGESPPATPRWVFMLGIIAIVMVLLFIILHLSGGGLRSHALP